MPSYGARFAALAATGILVLPLGCASLPEARTAGPLAAARPAATPATAAPAGALAPVRRVVAEWEPARGAMISWPLTVPHRLAIALARDTRLFTLCADQAGCAEARDWYARWGIDLARVEFVVVPQAWDASWIRDYGPHTVVDDRGRVALADARYELATPISGLACDGPLATPANGGWAEFEKRMGGKYDVRADDAAPAVLARALALPHLPLPFALTGGNFATDGRGLGLSTCVQANENRELGLTDAAFRDGAMRELGLDRFVWISNFEATGIQHIDCLLKILDGERMIVARPPADHPASALYERIVAEELAPLTTATGKPFEILRIDTARYAEDELAAYTNALILNDKVYVPLFGIAADEGALATWRAALPEHEVEGFEFVLADEPVLSPRAAKLYDTIGWTEGDALHCRVRAVFDPARLAPAGR